MSINLHVNKKIIYKCINKVACTYKYLSFKNTYELKINKYIFFWFLRFPTQTL